MVAEFEKHYQPRAAAEALGMSLREVRRLMALGAASKGRRGIWPVRRPSRKMQLIPKSALERYVCGRSFLPSPAESVARECTQ